MHNLNLSPRGLSKLVINLINYVYLIDLILFYNVNILAKLNELQYNTTSGIYEAKLVKIAGFSAYKNRSTYIHKIIGIPYAEKPERFEHSVIKRYESGIHFSQEPVFCHQSVNISAYGLFSLIDTPRMSEDCLTVNLYIPVPSSPEEEKSLKNMSVLIHIHGGSNMVGGASLFDGTMLAGHGKIIVAIINYRLSILGFLSDMTEKYSGNYGLRDQLLAVNWIKTNCDVLNCNPNSITLWGHSAGAGDVNWLSVSPLSNHLFQRVIIQSGSSFSYWGFDKMPHERYKALKSYFNCKNLPDEFTSSNEAMTKLIDNCLKNVSLTDLFSFKFALIDAPGPVYDGFLGANSLINEYSPKEMIDKNTKRSILDLDILTGINGVEGFSFEGYFSSSVRFWSQNKLTNEVILTLERIALLTREKCSQGSIIANRDIIEQFYESKVEKLLAENSDMSSEEAKRLKSIFVNSDFIFDIGFIELVKVLLEKRAESEYAKRGNLFVYEYLHENTGSQINFNAFKRHLKKNYPISTHFDGIDLAFGLPVAYKIRNKKDSFYDYPFSNFIFDSFFTEEDSDLSEVIMTYYTNFVKSGNPNIGDKVNRIWEPYTNNRAYLKLNNELLKQNDDGSQAQIHYGIREDLYNFWFVDMKKDSECTQFKTDYGYENRYQTKKNQPINRCIEKLNETPDYIYIKEMFLTEYENCMNTIETTVPPLKNIFNTFCLDIIIIKRLLIEYSVCCNQNETEITSTICYMKNLDPKYANYNISSLINFAVKQSVVSSKSITISSKASFRKTEIFLNVLFILTFNYIYVIF